METALLVAASMLIASVVAGIAAAEVERRRKHHVHVDTMQELAALKLDHARLRVRFNMLADKQVEAKPKPWCVVLERDDLSTEYVAISATGEEDAANLGNVIAFQTATRFVRAEPLADVLLDQFEGEALLGTLDGGF